MCFSCFVSPNIYESSVTYVSPLQTQKDTKWLFCTYFKIYIIYGIRRVHIVFCFLKLFEYTSNITTVEERSIQYRTSHRMKISMSLVFHNVFLIVVFITIVVIACFFSSTNTGPIVSLLLLQNLVS